MSRAGSEYRADLVAEAEQRAGDFFRLLVAGDVGAVQVTLERAIRTQREHGASALKERHKVSGRAVCVERAERPTRYRRAEARPCGRP